MQRALLMLWILCVPIAAHAKLPTPAPITAEQYRADLQRAAAKLRAMESTPQRPLASLLTPLSGDKKVRRADGATQIASGDEWQRRALEAPGNATVAQVKAARSGLEARLNSLDEWQRRDANGAYFAGADAQTRFNQIKNSGAIRTGPTALEDWWSRTKKSFYDFWKKLAGWMISKTPAPSSRVPVIDPLWIKALFIASVLALLGVIGVLVWRTFGNSFARRAPRRADEVLSDDEALLRLPPDELLERARAFARAGDFREALRHVYIRLLLQLDARGVWRYDARRTNWEHIELLRRHAAHSALAAPLADLTRRFDRVRYGGAACDNTDWNRFESDAFAVEEAVGGGSKPTAVSKRQTAE